MPLQGVQIRMADTIDTTSDAEGDYNFTVNTRDESEIKIHFSHECIVLSFLTCLCDKMHFYRCYSSLDHLYMYDAGYR